MVPEPQYEIAQLVSLGEAPDAQLAARYRVLRLFHHPDPQSHLQRLAPTVPVIITSVRQGLKRETIQALPNLKAVCSWGAGYDTLDVEAARSKGVVVSTTPGILSECVADMAWGLLLACARRVAAADRYVKDGSWRELGKFPLTTRIWGKRLGIFGLGSIGAAIARRGLGFDMSVRYHNRKKRLDLPEYDYEPSLEELAGWADFLVLACPGGPATHHRVGEDVLRALGPGGIVINIARGTVIDQAALIRLLESGNLGGAGLDVLEHEPGAPEVLKEMDQVVLTPHVGSATVETRRQMSSLVVDNAISFMETGRLLTPID